MQLILPRLTWICPPIGDDVLSGPRSDNVKEKKTNESQIGREHSILAIFIIAIIMVKFRGDSQLPILQLSCLYL